MRLYGESTSNDGKLRFGEYRTGETPVPLGASPRFVMAVAVRTQRIRWGQKFGGDSPSKMHIGTVTVDNVRGHETWMFRYDDAYVDASRPLLDPTIANVRGPQFSLGKGGFGFLADISPNRWGRKLIRRREKRDLMESDYLLGVCDLTRPRAIRIKLERDGSFVAEGREDAAPPWIAID